MSGAAGHARAFSGRLERRIARARLAGALLVLLSCGLSLGVTGAEGAFPGANGKIAFTSDRDDNRASEIYTMNADGTGQTRLTNTPAFDFRPAFSPESAKIAFTANRGDAANFEIYTMNADGTGQTRLTNDPAYDDYAAFSPDGSKIAFASDRDGDLEIWVVRTDGTSLTQLTSNDGATDLDPTFSPDGSKIAFVSDRDGNNEIYTMSASGTGQSRLTTANMPDEDPVFSPDGGTLAFARFFGSNDWEIFSMNADGSAQTNVTNNRGSEREDRAPAFSPDGTKIVFQAFTPTDPTGDVLTLNIDGTGRTNLTNLPLKNDSAADWGAQLPSAAVANVTVTEGNVGTTTATFTVSLSARSGAPARVSFATTNGTATAPADYQARSGTLTFAPGETSKAVAVAVNGDTLQEPNESFSLDLSNPTNATLLGAGRGVAAISDDDRPATTPPRYGSPTVPVAPFADCPTLTARVIRGSTAANRLTGTLSGDRIFAGAGDDVVDALEGDDCVDLGEGADRGQGGSGSDLIRGGLGGDRISGSSGRDRITGNSGNDRITGNSGNDRLTGGKGADRLSGGSGNDRLTGGRGADRLSGGSGNDRVSARDGKRDRINCGRGRDTVTADRTDRISRDCERVSRRGRR